MTKTETVREPERRCNRKHQMIFYFTRYYYYLGQIALFLTLILILFYIYSWCECHCFLHIDIYLYIYIGIIILTYHIFAVVLLLDSRDALAKGLYGRTFGWIVAGINGMLTDEANSEYQGKKRVIGASD